MPHAAPPDYPDTRALRILRSTYWSSAGWKQKPHTPPNDLAFAKSAGLMFDAISLNHDKAVAWALGARIAVSQEQVVSAFLASLSSRRLDLRSALGSYAVLRHFPKHKHRAFSRGDKRTCAMCGESPASRLPEDLNVLNFERFQWGGVRHDQPVYAAFDLDRLASTPAREPTADDVALLRAIVAAVRALPANSRPGRLDKALAPILKSNQEERRTLISILGFAGVLQPKGHPSYRTTFVPLVDREETNDDWTFPVGMWRGSDGVSQAALDDWFGAWLK